MQWRTVRLTRNGPRGQLGDLVEAPEPMARAMARDGRAEPAGAARIQQGVGRPATTLEAD